MSPHHSASDPPAAVPRERLWNRHAMTYLYDPLVRGTCRWLWNCPWPLVELLYSEFVQPGTTHLDVAPGTGHFLNRLPLQPGDLRLHLLDLHQGSLQTSGARLARFTPELHTHDALKPFPLSAGSVDSVAMSMVLHCLPGANIAAKSAVFDHVAQVLGGGGLFGGATVLAELPEGVELSARARGGLWALNRLGVFSNESDTYADLERELTFRFDEVRLVVHGAVALWLARGRGQ